MLKKLLFSLLFMGTFLNATAPTEESVTKLYIATFDRAPDKAGLDYWVYNSNLSQEEIAISFFEQQETKEKYPTGTSNEKFINSTYTNLFKRTPDDAGMNYWNDELNSGSIAKPIFIQAVVNGAQGDDAILLSNKTDIGLAFANSGSDDVSKAKNVLSNVTTNIESVTNTLNIFGLSLYSENEQKNQKFVNRYISDYAQVEKKIIDEDYASALTNIKDSVEKFSTGADFAYKLISEKKTGGVIFAATKGYMIPFIITALNLQPKDEKLAQFLAMGLIDILILRSAGKSDIEKVKQIY